MAGMAVSLEQRLASGPLLCDGATGTQLYARGVTDAPLEAANVTRPDAVRAVHLGYLRAGAELIETNTFGANAARLGAHRMAGRVEELNRAGVALAKEAARLHGQRVWVAGAMGPLGGEADAGLLGAGEERNALAEQADALANAGADLILLETFPSIAQLRLALDAVRSVCGLPVIAQLTFTSEGLTLGGDSPEDAAAALDRQGLLAAGANCSVGPDLLRSVVERMAPLSGPPLIVQPNAGLPAYVGGRLEYAASPEYFGETMREVVRAGASAVGGCCGTTPEHIAAARDALRGMRTARPRPSAAPRIAERTEVEPRRADGAPAPPTGLAERIARGEFAVTVEVSPPVGFEFGETMEKLRAALGHAHAVNVADSPRAQGRMSALAAASLVQSRMGVETVLHVAVRHRNLLALHSDLLGAHALGIRNVFTVMGDPPLAGDYPQATPVADVTASGLIRLMARFNEGVGANGKELDQPTSFFIGAALNCNAPNPDAEARALERKVQAGAHFLLTQPVSSPEPVERMRSLLGGFPLPVVMGALPFRSVRHARYLHHEVPGIVAPPEVIERLERAGDAAAEEGTAVVRELLTTLAGRIAGAYFIPPFGRFSVVAETMDGLALPGLRPPEG